MADTKEDGDGDDDEDDDGNAQRIDGEDEDEDDVALSMLPVIGRGAYGIVYGDAAAGTALKLVPFTTERRHGALRELTAMQLVAVLPGATGVVGVTFRGARLALKMPLAQMTLHDWLDKFRKTADAVAVDGAAAPAVAALKRPPLAAVRQVLRAVTRTLAHALRHCGIVHRDVKSQNILVDADPDGGTLRRVLLADWGMSTFAVRRRADLRRRDQSLGARSRCAASRSDLVQTVWYRAPEVLLDVRDSTFDRIDVWSVGVLALELLGLASPLWGDGTDVDQTMRIFRVVGTPTSDTWPELHAASDVYRGVAWPRWSATLAHQRLCDAIRSAFADYGADASVEQACSFIAGCLTLNPAARLSLAGAAKHAFLRDDDDDDGTADCYGPRTTPPPCFCADAGRDASHDMTTAERFRRLDDVKFVWQLGLKTKRSFLHIDWTLSLMDRYCAHVRHRRRNKTADAMEAPDGGHVVAAACFTIVSALIDSFRVALRDINSVLTVHNNTGGGCSCSTTAAAAVSRPLDADDLFRAERAIVGVVGGDGCTLAPPRRTAMSQRFVDESIVLSESALLEPLQPALDWLGEAPWSAATNVTALIVAPSVDGADGVVEGADSRLSTLLTPAVCLWMLLWVQVTMVRDASEQARLAASSPHWLRDCWDGVLARTPQQRLPIDGLLPRSGCDVELAAGLAVMCPSAQPPSGWLRFEVSMYDRYFA